MTPTAVATSSTGSETLLGPSPAPRVRRESTGLSGSKPTNAEVRVGGDTSVVSLLPCQLLNPAVLDCKMIVHKGCHGLVTVTCPKSSIESMTL